VPLVVQLTNFNEPDLAKLETPFSESYSHNTQRQLRVTTMSSIKGPSSTHFDGSGLRIAIVHARWNKSVIDALVAGTVDKLKECGVKDSNIIIQSVPGSFELPYACSK